MTVSPGLTFRIGCFSIASMNVPRARLIRLSAAAAILLLLIAVWCVRRNRASQDGGWATDYPDLPVDPAIVARQLEDLERREASVASTTWAGEQAADEASRTIEAFWNALNRADDHWPVVNSLAPSKFTLPMLRPPVALPWGVEWRSPGEGGEGLAGSAWAAKVAEWAASGWRIVQSEFRHIGYEPHSTKGQARSRIDLRVHLVRDGTGERAVLRGEVGVEWRERGDGPGELGWESMDARRLEWLVGRSPPPFEEVFREDLLPPTGSFFIDPLIVHDLDGDGLPEAILAARNRVYRRRADGSIEGTQLLPTDPPLVHSALVADFDGDGRADLLHAGFDGLFLAAGTPEGGFGSPARLAWSAEPRLRYAQAMTCGDIDADGDLDVWVAQYKIPYQRGQMPVPWDDANDGYPSHLLLNDGRGSFVEATVGAGLAGKRHRRTYSASFADLDDDGDLDLVLVNDFAGVDVFANDGRGHFEDRTAAWVPDPKAFGMAQAISDLDRDGRTDLLVIGMNSPAADRLNGLGLYRSGPDEITRRARVTHGNRLLLARPGGGFGPGGLLEVPLARTGWSWGVAAADFDNDGFVDVYVANGHETRESVRDYEREFWMHDIYVGTSRDSLLVNAYFIGKGSRTRGQGESYGGWEKNRLYLRGGSGAHVEVGHLMGVALEEDSRNVVATDMDGDGRVDLMVTTFEIWPKPRQTFRVFRNRFAASGNWVGLRFPESTGLGPLTGATVRLRAGGITHVQQRVAGDGYRSQNNGPMHFGLGKTETVEGVEVRWPDGRFVSLQAPAVNRYHTVGPSPPSRTSRETGY